MRPTILLVDLDGTLLDKDKDWELIEKTFLSMYPQGRPGEIRAFYHEHRGPMRQVDETIAAGIPVYGEDFWRVFYETDHRPALRADWQSLYDFCVRSRIRMDLFTEGSVGERPWSPEYAKNGYQPFKVDQLQFPFSALIFDDKVAALPDLLEQLVSEGYERVALLDDNMRILRAAHEMDMETYMIKGADEPESWLNGYVSTLTELTAHFPLLD
jgi:FMN phosphatase YigB (HAD superfamily)